MIKSVFSMLIYQPLYNGLIFLMSIMPGHDAGLSVIIFTILVKLLLFPLSQKAIKNQIEMKALEGDLALIKEKHKNDREAHAKATMNLYKEKKVNPFSGFLLALVQIPIILALYYIFYNGGLPKVDLSLLYTFVKVPDINMHFLGFVDISAKGGYILAILVAASQYFQVRFAMPAIKPKAPGEAPSVKDDLMRTMNLQMRYFLPAMVGVIAFNLVGAVSFYWITSNLFAIGQEVYVRKHIREVKSVKLKV